LKPNILYVFTDQQSAAAMSCAGNGDLATPAMDRLAAQGVRFDNAYCTFPLCTPSRASMFTGLFPHEAGITFNEQSISPTVRPTGIGNLLKAAGYDCGYGGKWHIPWCAPMEDGHGFEYFNAFDDCRLAEDTLAYIRRPRQGPFFVVASFDNPHNICEVRENVPLSTGPLGAAPAVEECPLLPANFAPSPYEPACLDKTRSDRYSPDDWRRYRWAYYRLVERVDTEIGKLLDGLDALGLADDTLVIFSSDHGELAGAHRLAAKLPLYDECSRVPMIVRVPGGGAGSARPDRVDLRLISNGLDIYATICDYADVPMPPGRVGRSLRPVLEDREPAVWHDHVVIETQLDRGGNVKGRAVRTDRYKYIAYSRGADREQLFDMQDDPGEMVNLAISSRHRDVLQRHRDRLRDWCVQTGDSFGFHYTRSRVPFIVPGDQYAPDTGGIPDTTPMLHPPVNQTP